jgi:hypothetical protein
MQPQVTNTLTLLVAAEAAGLQLLLPLTGTPTSQNSLDNAPHTHQHDVILLQQ